MQFKSIISLCLLAVVTADKDPKTDSATTADNKTPEVISPEATAKDIRKADCAKLTVKALNGLKDAKACSGLTAECAKEFDVTDLCSDCLSNVPNSEWKRLDKKTVEQIVKSKVDVLSLTPEQLKEILSKINLSEVPTGFTGYVVREGKLLDVIFGTSDAKTIAAFLTADNVAALNPAVFRRFGETLIASLNDDAFSKITATQLSMIPSDSFAGFSAKQWSTIPPTTLTGLGREQASKLSKECWNATTPAQIASFGPLPSTVAKLSAKDPSARNQEILNRRQFKQNHPCMALEGAKGGLNESQAKVLESKCKDIVGLSVNGAGMLGTSLIAVGAVMALALVPALI